jgi:short-subunit dehydrogenase
MRFAQGGDRSSAKTVALQNQLKGMPIDYLVNAAGISRDGLLVQVKEQDLLDTINTNLIGTITLSQYVAKGMMRKRSGKLKCAIFSV